MFRKVSERAFVMVDTLTSLCRHFGVCGGCTLQDVPSTEYLAKKRDHVRSALARAGLISVEVEPPTTVLPQSRRRAVFRILSDRGQIRVGFFGLKTHDIVDMTECYILTPRLLALSAKLRAGLDMLSHGQHGEVHVTEASNGLDLAFRAHAPLTPARVAALAKADFGATRISWNATLAVEIAPPEISFDGIVVRLPVDGFLQPTLEGEVILQKRVREVLQGARRIVDLFSGCGTFSLPLARAAKIHAVEKDQAMLDALAQAARAMPGLKPVTTAKRDLFKLPVTAGELSRFDGACLDPPRAGAEAQARQLAHSAIPSIAYVSCDAASFARDAKILVDGGYRIGRVIPVDQFLWSSHIELVADFSKGAKR